MLKYTNNIHRQSNTIKYFITITYIQIHTNTLIYTHNIHLQCMFLRFCEYI